MATTDRRRTIAIVAAGLAVVVVTVVIAVAGIVPYPSFPTLTDAPQPAPPSRVAFVRWGEQARTCLYVADTDGTTHQVRCGDDLGGAGARWDGPGRLVLRHYESGGVLDEVVDATSGTTITTRTTRFPIKTPDEPANPPPVTVRSDAGRASLLVDEGGTLRTLVDVSGPRTYRFDNAEVSPDGGWVALTDSADRLLVVSLTGDPAPRIWVADAAYPSWEPSE